MGGANIEPGYFYSRCTEKHRFRANKKALVYSIKLPVAFEYFDDKYIADGQVFPTSIILLSSAHCTALSW